MLLVASVRALRAGAPRCKHRQKRHRSSKLPRSLRAAAAPRGSWKRTRPPRCAGRRGCRSPSHAWGLATLVYPLPEEKDRDSWSTGLEVKTHRARLYIGLASRSWQEPEEFTIDQNGPVHTTPPFQFKTEFRQVKLDLLRWQFARCFCGIRVRKSSRRWFKKMLTNTTSEYNSSRNWTARMSYI
jgi:hypothetical protein